MGEVVIAACGGAAVGGIFSLITWGLNRQAKKKDKKTGVAVGVQILLYDRIKFLCKRHIDAKHICTEDLEDIIRMHEIYHNELNGNGYLSRLIKEVKELPINKGV